VVTRRTLTLIKVGTRWGGHCFPDMRFYKNAAAELVLLRGLLAAGLGIEALLLRRAPMIDLLLMVAFVL